VFSKADLVYSYRHYVTATALSHKLHMTTWSNSANNPFLSCLLAHC